MNDAIPMMPSRKFTGVGGDELLVSFAPDESQLAVFSPYLQVLDLWGIGTNARCHLMNELDDVVSYTFSTSTDQLVIVCPDSAHILALPAFAELQGCTLPHSIPSMYPTRTHYHPQSHSVVVTAKNGVYIWDTNDGVVLPFEMSHPDAVVLGITFAEARPLAFVFQVGDAAAQLSCVDVPSGQPLHRVEIDFGFFPILSPDGRLAVICRSLQRSAFEVWNLASWGKLYDVEIDFSVAPSWQFSWDSSLLIQTSSFSSHDKNADSRSVLVTKSLSGQVVQTFSSAVAAPGVCLSQDNSLLALVANRNAGSVAINQTCFFDLIRGNLLAMSVDHPTNSRNLAFSSHKSWFVSVHDDNSTHKRCNAEPSGTVILTDLSALKAGS